MMIVRMGRKILAVSVKPVVHGSDTMGVVTPRIVRQERWILLIGSEIHLSSPRALILMIKPRSSVVHQ